MTEASAEPLLPPAFRRPAVASVALNLVRLVVLGVRYCEDTSAARLDRWVVAHLRSALRAHLMLVVAVLGRTTAT